MLVNFNAMMPSVPYLYIVLYRNIIRTAFLVVTQEIIMYFFLF